MNAGARKEGKILRPAVLVFSFLALMCVVAVVGSSRSARSALGQTGVSSEIPLSLMPDPAEAVHVAQETVDQVEPMHTHGAWIGESYCLAEVLSILFSCAAPPDWFCKAARSLSVILCAPSDWLLLLHVFPSIPS